MKTMKATKKAAAPAPMNATMATKKRKVIAKRKEGEQNNNRMKAMKATKKAAAPAPMKAMKATKKAAAPAPAPMKAMKAIKARTLIL